MTARSFLIRGLVAGLVAGFAAFAVAFVVGEPSVDRAIAIEETHSETAAEQPHSEMAAHSHDGDAVVSRQDQSTWGLLTGTLTVGVTLGGVVALAAAGVMGRIGRLTPAASTALVAALGYVSFALVPFLKYPANPPAVGDPATIDQRTALYFGFVLVSVVAAVACTALAVRLIGSRGPQTAVLTGVGAYVAIVVAGGVLMPTVDEIGAFPGDVLWNFRLASIGTTTALWATVGVGLTVLVRRLHAEQRAQRARREFAASL